MTKRKFNKKIENIRAKKALEAKKANNKKLSQTLWLLAFFAVFLDNVKGGQ